MTSPDLLAVVRRLANGGLERVLLEQATAVRGLGLEPRVLALEDPGPLAPRFVDAGIPVEALDLPAAAPLALLRGLPRLTRRLGELSPRLIQVHMRRTGFLARLAARRLGIPTLVALHNEDLPVPSLLAPLEAWLDRESRFLAVSHAVAHHATRSRGLPRARIEVLANGLPAPHPVRRGPERSGRVGFLGKLEEKKDPERFLAAARELGLRRPGLRFLLAGDGPLRARVTRQVARERLPVELVGAVEEGAGFLGSLEVACFPSRREGFGLAVGEALSRGVPVVLSDIPAFREVYGDLPEECFLPRQAGAGELAERIRRLLDHPALGREVLCRGREVLSRYGLDAAREGYRAYYRRLLAVESRPGT